MKTEVICYSEMLIHIPEDRNLRAHEYLSPHHNELVREVDWIQLAKNESSGRFS
jgi:hypothetical protein